MTLLQKTHLSGRFGRPYYVISGLVTIAACGLEVYDPMALSECILVKFFSIPVIFFLYNELKKKELYFYLNLGISRKEFRSIPVVVESVAFVLMMVISCFIGYAIQ